MNKIVCLVTTMGVIGFASGGVAQGIGEMERDIVNLVEHVSQSVVSVAAVTGHVPASKRASFPSMPAKSVGCGIVFDENGLILTTASIVGYAILYYLLMQDYVQHDTVEAQYFTLMSSALAKLGLAGEAGQAAPSVPQREYVTSLLLTLITCGIYGIYWMYVMIKDFNEHFLAQVPWEDFILTALR